MRWERLRLIACTRTFEKMKEAEFDRQVADTVQSDPQKMILLSIFEEQIMLLVNEGQPDLSRYLDSLESGKITSSSEVSALRMKFGLESVSYPFPLETIPNTLSHRKLYC